VYTIGGAQRGSRSFPTLESARRLNVQDILDIKGSEIITVKPDATIQEMTRIMADRGIGTVLVTDADETLVGIVSERDIVRSIADRGEQSFGLCADDLMTRSLITCTRETSIAEALAPMSRNGIRHLPVIGNDGIAGLISIRDILNHRAQSLESDIESLTVAAEEVRQAKEKAEISDRAKTDFLANMSHELKTPLNAVIGFSEMMAGEVLGPIGTPQYREYAQEICDSGRHLVEIVNDILDVSRLEANAVEVQDHHIRIENIVASSLRLVADRARESDILLSVSVPSDLPLLIADQRMIKQMVNNLLTNAVKFTPHGGKV
jgi:signal transduction histidine kinase